MGETAWRKRTRFRAVNVDLGPAVKHCCGRGVCTRSNIPHMQLEGKDLHGVFYTKIAEACPRQLCRRVVQWFSVALLAQHSRDFRAYLE